MDSKNLIMGSVAIIVVILLGLIIFSNGIKTKNTSSSLTNVKAYIHHDAEGENKGFYSQCKLSTEELVKIRNEFQKIYNVKDEDYINGKSIKGEYKVEVEDEYIAFDKENDGIMYLGTIGALFKVDSSMYNIVINACNR